MADSERYYLRWSKTSLWLTPICAALFVGAAWLLGRVVSVPPVVYWIILGLLGLTWLGDLVNVIYLRRSDRGRP